MNREQTPHKREWLSRLKYFVKALIVIVVVSLLTFVLDNYGWLKSFETGALDRFFILRQRVPASHVVVVEIDDEDYEQLFHETSPLDPETLSDLIAAIAKNNPRLIAVDIDTSAGVFQKMNVPTVETKIVWARGARHSAVNTQREAGVASTVHPPPYDYVFVPEKVLGRVEPNNLLTGIALMPLDDDSHIRHFRREYFTTGTEGTSTPLKKMDSFHWAVVRKHCELTGADQRCEELFRPHADEAEHGEGELILNLAVDPYAFEAPIKASRVLTEANTGSVTEGSPVYHLLKDKIVLLGGKYEAARDSYPTSLGEKYGVDLNAIAIESELSGTGIRRAGHVTLVVLEVAAGLFLVGLNVLFPSGWKRIITLATIPLLALCGSFIAFSTLALWANFIPTLVAAQIHFLYDKLAEAKHLEREILELKRKLQSYEQRPHSEPPTEQLTEQLDEVKLAEETPSTAAD